MEQRIHVDLKTAQVDLKKIADSREVSVDQFGGNDAVSPNSSDW